MTQIEQMIQDMCPNGVEFKKLGDLGVFENTGVDKKSHDDEQEVTLLNFMDVCRHKYIDASIPSMVVTAPDRKIEQCNVLKDDIFITPSSETIDEIGFAAVIMEDLPNVVYSYHIMRYRLKQPNTTTAKFIRYLFEAPVIRKQILKGAKGLTRFGLSKYQFADIEIPLPPLEIQNRIVEILDRFSALAAELQAELQMRRKQYEYYRTRLLTPHSESDSTDNTDDATNSSWQWKTLGEIGTFKYGFTDKAKDKGTARYIRITDIDKNGCLSQEAKYIDVTPDNNEYILQKGDILMARTGATYGKTLYYNEDYVSIYASFLIKISLDSALVIPKYYWHFAQSQLYWEQANKLVGGGAQPQFNAGAVSQIRIPLPSLSEQQRIVAILDKFEALTTSLSDGIPAEQIAQQRRYEYYRDKLLSFPGKPE